jgi:HD-GYP domain-containing protein (c-di-GMP phosphodiesterase class II)
MEDSGLASWAIGMPEVRRPGRPTVRTEARAEIIIAQLKRGQSQVAAAAAAGISIATLKRWLAEDESIRERVDEAYGLGEQALVEKLWEAAEKDPVKSWQAAAWLLERTRPERFGRRDRIAIESVQAKAKEIAERMGLSAEEIMKEAERIVREGR